MVLEEPRAFAHGRPPPHPSAQLPEKPTIRLHCTCGCALPDFATRDMRRRDVFVNSQAFCPSLSHLLECNAIFFALAATLIFIQINHLNRCLCHEKESSAVTAVIELTTRVKSLSQ